MARPVAVDDRVFVEGWMVAYSKRQNQQWLAKHLGMSATAISRRHLLLKNSGIQLPALGANQPAVAGNVSDQERRELNDYINRELNRIAKEGYG